MLNCQYSLHLHVTRFLVSQAVPFLALILPILPHFRFGTKKIMVFWRKPKTSVRYVRVKTNFQFQVGLSITKLWPWRHWDSWWQWAAVSSVPLLDFRTKFQLVPSLLPPSAHCQICLFSALHFSHQIPSILPLADLASKQKDSQLHTSNINHFTIWQLPCRLPSSSFHLTEHSILNYMDVQVQPKLTSRLPPPPLPSIFCRSPELGWPY
jgi:hypothetical protein